MTVKELEIQLALGSLSLGIKEDLASNLNTSRRILAILSTDKDWWVKCKVANNLNTPKEILTILSTDKDWWTRSNVAMNPSTLRKILTTLSEDEDIDVKTRATNALTKKIVEREYK